MPYDTLQVLREVGMLPLVPHSLCSWSLPLPNLYDSFRQGPVLAHGQFNVKNNHFYL